MKFYTVKIVSVVLLLCLFFTNTIVVSAQDSQIAKKGYIKAFNERTGEYGRYESILKNNKIYMQIEDIAIIGDYECEKQIVEKKDAQAVYDSFTIISDAFDKINLDKLFVNDRFEYLRFRHNGDFATEILCYNEYIQTMNKSYKVGLINHDGKNYYDLEQMLFLMHAQWCVEDSILYCTPMGNTIFDFINRNFAYMTETSVQHNELLINDEGKWTHSTRVVLSHIFNDIDMRIFIPFGSDLIKEEMYKDAILQLATLDDSFIDDEGSKKIDEYLKTSELNEIENGLNCLDTSIGGVDKVIDYLTMPKTDRIKFNRWNDISDLGTPQIKAMSQHIGSLTDSVEIAQIAFKLNEVATRSKSWGDQYVDGLEILSTINKEEYGDYAKDIVNASEDLLDEFNNPKDEVAEQALLDVFDFVFGKLSDKVGLGYIESIITVSNMAIKSNQEWSNKIENADLMNTVHALINVENVFLSEFVDIYHDYFNYISKENESSNLLLWELMASASLTPQQAVEGAAIHQMRNSLEMFLKTSLRNKTFVYHFNCELSNDHNWENTQKAKEMKDDIYKTYAVLSELISTSDYDKTLFLGDFENIESDDYGMFRTKITEEIFTEGDIPEYDLDKLVVDAYRKESGNADFAIPKIELESGYVKEINKEIWEMYYKPCEEFISSGNIYGEAQVSYEWHVKNDILFVLICSDFGQAYPSYHVFSINLKTQEAATNDEIIKYAGLSMDEYYTKAKQAMGSHHWERANKYGLLDDEGYVACFNNALVLTLEDSNVKKSTPYLNSEGDLCILARIFAVAGPEGYVQPINLENFVLIDNFDKKAEIKDADTNSDTKPDANPDTNPDANIKDVYDNDSLTVTGTVNLEYYEINKNNAGTVAIVSLKQPIQIYAHGINYDNVLLEVESVQISIDKKLYDVYDGQEVTVTGSVMYAHTGHHRRDIVLRNCKIK